MQSQCEEIEEAFERRAEALDCSMPPSDCPVERPWANENVATCRMLASTASTCAELIDRQALDDCGTDATVEEQCSQLEPAANARAELLGCGPVSIAACDDERLWRAPLEPDALEECVDGAQSAESCEALDRLISAGPCALLQET